MTRNSKMFPPDIRNEAFVFVFESTSIGPATFAYKFVLLTMLLITFVMVS